MIGVPNFTITPANAKRLRQLWNHFADSGVEDHCAARYAAGTVMVKDQGEAWPEMELCGKPECRVAFEAAWKTRPT